MVLKRLFKRDRSQSLPAVAPGSRVYAIGDIHGRLDLLDQLLAMIDDDAKSATGPVERIILGDLVDRGPDSAGVVQRLLDLAEHTPCRFLAGNHEEIFLRALTGDREALRLFTRIGGRETILSYGISREEYDSTGYDELFQLLVDRVPPEHIAFLEGFEDQIRSGDYLFVHAGIRPGVPLEEQARSDLRWIRNSFLDHRGDLGVMVVHGHTITDEVDEQVNRIGIDTGAYASGHLTALALDGTDRWYLAT